MTTTPLMARCDLCNNQEKKREYQARLAFDATPEQLVRSACDKGCESCLVILEALRQASSLDGCQLSRDVRTVYVRCHNQRNNQIDSLSLEVYFIDDRPRVELEIYSLLPDAWRAILPRQPISAHPLSEKGLDWIRRHIESCRRTHRRCAAASENLLPKRVLSLEEDADGGITVRLVDFDYDFDTPRYAPYVALSHVWGEERSCITTAQTLKDHKRQIPWDIIPKTFKDAIVITLKLNIQFIWIDSLAIIQDDLVDWEIESSNMASTYENATLTLAATASSSDSHGCFPESQNLPSDVEIELPHEIPACRVAVRAPSKHWIARTSRQIKECHPLLSRGWAFQERLLSPRILHFCGQELAWECRELCVCECGGLDGVESHNGSHYQSIRGSHWDDNIVNTSDWLQLPIRKRTICKPIGTSFSADGDTYPPSVRLSVDVIERRESESQDFSEVAKQFHRIVIAYSELELTKPTDRLPALSGLCERIQKDRGDYIVGLWSDSICADLMWRKDALSLELDKAIDKRNICGPSWSWVAANGPVKYWFDLASFEESDEELQPRRNRYEESVGQKGTVAQRAELEAWREKHVVWEQEPAWDHKESVVRDHPADTEPLGLNRDQVTYEISNLGRNPFGMVKAASLKVRASATTAVLCYTRKPDVYTMEGKVRVYDHEHYTLKIGIPEVQSATRYNIPFFADYPLGLDGPCQVPDQCEVALLLIHPKVCLVLRLIHPQVSSVLRQDHLFRLSLLGELRWERIGISRIPEELITYYKVDWMRDSTVQNFMIV